MCCVCVCSNSFLVVVVYVTVFMVEFFCLILVRELGSLPLRSVSASRSLNYLVCLLSPPREFYMRAELGWAWKLIGRLSPLLFALTAFSNCWKFSGLIPGGSLGFIV